MQKIFEKKLINECDIADFVKKTDFNDKLKILLTKMLQIKKTCRRWKEIQWAIRES